jgi:hypothetical protein
MPINKTGNPLDSYVSASCLAATKSTYRPPFCFFEARTDRRPPAAGGANKSSIELVVEEAVLGRGGGASPSPGPPIGGAPTSGSGLAPVGGSVKSAFGDPFMAGGGMDPSSSGVLVFVLGGAPLRFGRLALGVRPRTAPTGPLGGGGAALALACAELGSFLFTHRFSFSS